MAAKALLEGRLKAVNRLYFIPELRPKLGDFCSELAKNKKSYAEKGWSELTKMVRNDEHGGIVVAAEESNLISYKPKFLKEWQADNQSILVADAFDGPRQFGRIIRSAACFGIKKIIVSKNAQALLSETNTFFEAAGTMETVQFYKVDSIKPLIKPLNDSFITLYLGGSGAQRISKFKKPIIAPGKPNAILVSNGESQDDNKTSADCVYKLKIDSISSDSFNLDLETNASVILSWLFRNEKQMQTKSTGFRERKKQKAAQK